MQASQGPPKRMTLPPPEWTVPAAEREHISFGPPPLARRKGGRAEEAALRAQVETSRANGDAVAFARAAVHHARWLASRDRDLDEAVRLAESAIAAGADDPDLFRELSSWLESLGEPARAAEALRAMAERNGGTSLRSLDQDDAAYLLVRVGVLLARANEPGEAATAFEQAMELDRRDALAAELLGALSAWAPEAVPQARGAEAYVEAARRRADEGAEEGELEDLLRAFATDAANERATAALATALLKRKKHAAIDEIWRAHGVARNDPEVHARRREDAVAAGDLTRALGAALDEGLDAVFTGEGADRLNGLLLRMGLTELLAARLEARAKTTGPQDRARAYVELARLYAGPLADPTRAVGAHVAALAADPVCEEAIVALRATLGEAERALDVPGDPREGATWRLAKMLRAISDEGERHRQLIDKLTRATGYDPRWAAAAARAAARSRRAEDANEASKQALERAPSRATSSNAWVDARMVGDVAVQAYAIEVLASSIAAPARAVLLAVASSRYGEAGDRERARHAAELAVQAEPSSVRAVATLADAVVGETDRGAAAALERAVSLAFARASWCAALSQALEAIGEDGYAVAWAQRTVALRPGDPVAIEQLLTRILGARDPSRLAEALAWVLSQPQPLEQIAALFARSLTRLADLDAERAVVLARRALEVYGPAHEPLRVALLEVAKKSGDDAFAVAVLERCISASVAPSESRAQAFSELADRRKAMGDRDGEARVIARAARELGKFPELLQRSAALLGDGVSADGELALMEARAEMLSLGNDRATAANAATAWRDYGAAIWDLAGDHEAAMRTWIRAAKNAPAKGFQTLGADLQDFAGAGWACERLVLEAEREGEALASGALYAEAARAALAVGENDRAIDLCHRAVLENPFYADALTIAETAAPRVRRELELSALYDVVGTRALGRFGRRAAHYRAARFFEQRDMGALALKHASQAFLAVPTEGATFLLLARTSRRAGDAAMAVRTLEQVADSSKFPRARAGWLLKAATLAGDGEDGTKTKVDVLFKAIAISPDLATLGMLADAAAELLRRVPDEREVLEMRLMRASKSLTAKLEGPDGARVALAFATMSLTLFDDPDATLDAVTRALEMDADLDEYAKLVAHAAALARGDTATHFVAAQMKAAEKPYANVGIAALKLIAGVAIAQGNIKAAARAFVLAGERDPDDDALIIEADAASAHVDDAKLLERFAKKVPRERRAEALTTRARALAADGAYTEAAALFERAAELSPTDSKADLERELREAYDAAGRGADVEERAKREAQALEASPRERAERWTEIAERREQRRDLAGALRALVEAAKIDSEPIERWSAIERVAELSGDDTERVTALRELTARVGADGAVPVRKRLARALEARGDASEAERTWREVLAIDADDEDADIAVENIINARAAYDELVEHLGKRAERISARSGHREALRAVRLRRAAILEQRLGRVGDACEELVLLLKEWPDNAGALRYLADLYERGGEPARAVPLWRKATALEPNPAAQDELELRAARALHAAGDNKTAVRHVRAVLMRNPSSMDALELQIDFARAAGEHKELGDALEALAGAAIDSVSRSDMLLEAAQAAGRCGDAALALARAQRAAQLTPERASPQLFARGLEYRSRGAGDPAEARRTIEELARVREDTMATEDTALRAFLLAEALDVVQGGGAGMRELARAQADLKDNALVAAGIAERLTRQRSHAAAVPYFDMALKGSLFGLRARGAVALAGGEAAIASAQLESAMRFFDEAASDETTRATALGRGAHLAATQGWIDVARERLAALLALIDDEAGARSVSEIAQKMITCAEPPQRASAIAGAREIVHGLLRWPAACASLEHAVEEASKKTPSVAPNRSSSRTSVRPAAVSSAPPASPRSPELARLEEAVAHAATAGDRDDARVRLARAHYDEGSIDAAETVLWDGLTQGSLVAGDFLVELLSRDPSRTDERVRARRLLVDAAPGDSVRLEALRQAAIDNDDRIYARAVEHVLRAFDPGAGPLPPPPLSAQPEHTGMLALLTKPATGATGEALSLLWEGAHSIFLRDPQSYGITGVARVVPGSTSPLARIYEAAIRVLDTPRIPLFALRATGGLSASVALIQPPSVVLNGDAREDSPELRFALGRGMAAALPQNVLLLGLPLRESRLLYKAMLGAFGAPEFGRALDATSGKMAESFWQLIPQRAQRRLQELLGTGALPDYEQVVDRAHHAGRRVGMFLAGDFGAAARAFLAEQSVDPAELTRPRGLRGACERFHQLADLLRLAVSPEYAEARWHPPQASSQRGTLSNGRFSIV